MVIVSVLVPMLTAFMLLAWMRRRVLSRPVVFRDVIPFTPGAGDVVARAPLEARLRGQSHVGPEHLLLAVTAIVSAEEWSALAPAGVGVQDVLSRMDAALKAEPLPVSDVVLPYTSRTWRALEESLDSARRARSTVTEVRDLLVGLLREDRSEAAVVLRDFGFSPAQLGRAT